MILFLEYSAGRERGGEVYAEHLHNFLRRRFDDFYPEHYTLRPKELLSATVAARSSLALVKQHDPDLIVVDVSSGMRNVMAIRWMKKRGRKVMVIVLDQRMNYKFNNFFLVKWLIRRFERYVVRSADIIITISEYMSQMAQRMAGRKIPTVNAPPGVELPFDAVNKPCEPQSNISGTIEFINPGEPSERKGTFYLLEAMALLKDLDLRLHITGTFHRENSYSKKLIKLIERHSLGDLVIFHGYIERNALFELYRRCSFFVLPSLSEGYGIAMAEALHFGLPVVASNAAAIPEMVQDGVNALLVEPKDPHALASAIRKLATDQPLRERMRQANLTRTATLPTWADFDATLQRELVPAIEKLTGLKAK